MWSPAPRMWPGRCTRSFRNNPPVCFADSPPSSGALGSAHKVSVFAKAAPTRGGGIALAMTVGFVLSRMLFVLQLAGAQLNVTSLDLDSGEVKLTGRIDTVEYTAARTPGGFLSRLLR